MENYRKIIGSLIILFLSTFFIHNVSALELTTEVEPTGTTYEITDLVCTYNDNSVVTRSTNCVNPKDFSTAPNLIKQLRTVQKINVTEGNYYRTFLTIKTIGGNPEILYRIDTDYSNWSIVNFNEIVNDTQRQDFIRVCRQTNCQAQADGISGWDYSINSPYFKVYEVTLRAKHTGSYYFIIGNNTQPFVWWNYEPETNNTTNVYVGIVAIEEFKSNSQIDQAEEKTEEATEEGQSNSETAQSDNEGATSSLLDVAGGIISAFGTSSSNCNFNMDLGNVDFGNINLCSGKPSEFSPIIDTVVVLMLIPIIFMTSISLVHQFINLTKFAQGGD